jgi:hypothetical protein
VIALVILVALLGGGIWVVVRVARVARTVGPVGRDGDHDGASSLMALAASLMPKDFSGWGAAMRSEFEQVEGRPARWHFALGCLRTALRPTHGIGGNRRRVAVAITCGIILGAALAIYGQLRYPAETAWGPGYDVLLVLFLIAGTWLALRGCGRSSTGARISAHHGIVAGVAVGVMYLVAVTPLTDGGYVGLLGVGTTIVAGAMATRANSDNPTGVRTGMWVGLWVGLISGVVFFVGLMTLTFAAAGWWTYDHEAVSAFNGFGPVTERGHRLAQWPGFAAFLVRRESAVALLVGFIIGPLLAIAAGTVGGAIGGRRQRSGGLAAGPA